MINEDDFMLDDDDVKTPTNDGDNTPTKSEGDSVDLTGNETPDITGKDNTKTNNSTEAKTEEPDTTETNDLETGTTIEFEGKTYTISENKDLVDSEGKVFKEAKDVKSWIDSNVIVDENEFDYNTLKETYGDVSDDEGNVIEFSNTVDGLNAYVKAVIDKKIAETQEGAVNRMLNSNPILKEFVDYLEINGSAKGFGDMPDRTGIVLDPNNETQQINIIRMAAKEFGIPIDDSYIKYLKDNDGLRNFAQTQLTALQKKDIAAKKQIEEDANKQREARQKEYDAYWSKVKSTIDSCKIGKFTIPKSFTTEVDGKKILKTTDDFYNYVSKPVKDENGNVDTRYNHDLNKLSDEERLAKDLIDAYVMFNGGSYDSIVTMLAKEKEVQNIKLKSEANKTKKSIKITKPTRKTNIEDILID